MVPRRIMVFVSRLCLLGIILVLPNLFNFSFALAKLNKQVCVSCVCEAKNCKMRDSRLYENKLAQLKHFCPHVHQRVYIFLSFYFILLLFYYFIFLFFVNRSTNLPIMVPAIKISCHLYPSPYVFF